MSIAFPILKSYLILGIRMYNILELFENCVTYVKFPVEVNGVSGYIKEGLQYQE